MKELSIEEKAKRYDEILVRAEGANLPYYKEDIMSKVKEFVDYLIPELKDEDENADEKVRKALIKLVTNHASMDLFIEYDIHLDEALAWLGKQGEQKPAAWSEEDVVAIDCAVEVLNKDLPSLAASIERLKSLKDRVQPQWKPSDAQVIVVDDIIRNGHLSNANERIMCGLLDDLKKLREE